MAWTVAGVIRDGAARAPGMPMLTGQGADGGMATRTWADEDARSSRLAQALQAEGVGPGDRVAILDKNGLAYFDLLFGAAKLNAVTVAVNWRLAPPEILEIINDARAKVLVVGHELLPALTTIEDQLSTVRVTGVADGSDAKHESLDEWVGEYAATDPGLQAAGGDVAIQLYTSGTTGVPKGVMLSHANLACGLPQLSSELGLTETSVNMAAMPLFHIGGSGWALAGLAVGAHTVVIREIDPAGILATIGQWHITHAFLVPAVLQFLLAVPGVSEVDTSCLELVLYGASPISDDVLRRCLQTFRCQFAQVYGMTETTGAITILRASEHDPDGPHPERLRSCGVPMPGVEIRIVDPESATDVAVGDVGELWTRSRQNMVGYWEKPRETEATVGEGDWLRTGDAGYLDGDGFIYLHDRIKDMIVSGGENVYPAEVENVLMNHPEIADAAVIGVPDGRWGETVKAVIVPAVGASPTEESVIGWCRERLAHFKCPTSVDMRGALPRNPSGKILKRELRAAYWEGHERRIN